jgi:hypothetical protein
MRRPAMATGFGKPRRLRLNVGTITLRRPRVRALAERCTSQLLPLFKRARSKEQAFIRHFLAGQPGIRGNATRALHCCGVRSPPRGLSKSSAAQVRSRSIARFPLLST